jgi:hypothetical protein
MAQSRLKPGFDPLWQSEFLDFRLLKLSKTAFILRQMYRLYRDFETNVCNLSDLQIRNITGWDRDCIKSAREQLIKLKEITPCGYHTFKVRPFQQHQTCGKIPQPTQKPVAGKTGNQLPENPATTCGKTPQLLRENPATHPISDRLTDIQTGKPSVNNPVENHGATGSRHCRDCGIYDPEHLDVKGNKTGYCSFLGTPLPPFTVCDNCTEFTPKSQDVVR